MDYKMNYTDPQQNIKTKNKQEKRKNGNNISLRITKE